MPAAIVNDGTRDLFASHREVAWHGLGTVFQSEVTDYREMLRLAGLDGWDVHEVECPLPQGVSRFVKPTKHIVATIGTEQVILGTTGERYEIVQNEDMFSFLQALQDGARWETAGAIKDGRQVFGSIALDREIVLDPTGVADVVKAYLLVAGSHDGSGSVQGGRTAVRVVCKNTLDMAMGQGIAQAFKFRHTSTVDARMKAGAEEWRNSHVYFDNFEKEAQALMAQKVTNKQYLSLLDGFVGAEPETNKKGAQTKWENKRGLFVQAWQGEANAGIRGTGWGAVNALTEANQWGRGVQNTENGAENFAAAGAGFDGPTQKFRQSALVAVKALAG